MPLVVTNTVHNFNTLIYSFIQTEHIDGAKVETIDEYVNLIESSKEEFAKSNYNRRELVRIFSGLNLIKNFLAESKKHLLLGVEKKENPKSAKDIYQFTSTIVDLANKIDSYCIKQAGTLSNEINSMSIDLRERLRAESLYPNNSSIINLKDKQTKHITQTLVRELGI